jgi:hypothetical protein
MQRKQQLADARRLDDKTNVAPRQNPPLVTRVELEVRDYEGRRMGISYGILIYPPRYIR